LIIPATHPANNTIHLWYDREAEEAARFYAPSFASAFEAMMQMGKIDIAAIEAARRG
jgi:predicted 3-demethylubiquinone-9 3-methyltransferase (glyoxalase superfamily)